MFRNPPAFRAASLILASVVTLLAAHAQAEPAPSTPVQLALWNPLQIFASERSVVGFRYSLLWGVNQDVTGVDFSTLGNKANGNVVGFQGGLLLNQVGGDFAGVQFNGVVNEVDGDFTGYQSGTLSLVHGDFAGLQFGIFGADTREHIRGLQWGLTGASFAGEITGVQAALFASSTDRGSGLQLALINVAKEMKGLQLGLINFNENGFLPVFPFLNFGL